MSHHHLHRLLLTFWRPCGLDNILASLISSILKTLAFQSLNLSKVAHDPPTFLFCRQNHSHLVIACYLSKHPRLFRSKPAKRGRPLAFWRMLAFRNFLERKAAAEAATKLKAASNGAYSKPRQLQIAACGYHVHVRLFVAAAANPTRAMRATRRDVGWPLRAWADMCGEYMV